MVALVWHLIINHVFSFSLFCFPFLAFLLVMWTLLLFHLDSFIVVCLYFFVYFFAVVALSITIYIHDFSVNWSQHFNTLSEIKSHFYSGPLTFLTFKCDCIEHQMLYFLFQSPNVIYKIHEKHSLLYVSIFVLFSLFCLPDTPRCLILSFIFFKNFH